MILGWLKHYTPRGLYGRAALILLAPILTILLIATLIFIQRHYQDVARQMTASMSLEINMILDRMDAEQDGARALEEGRRLASPLQIDVSLDAGPAPGSDRRLWYDFAGPAVFEEFRRRIDGVVAVDMLTDMPRARLWAQTRFGDVRFAFRASRITASNPHQFLVIILLVALVMSLVSFAFLRNQLRPIRRLARAAEAFGRGRNVPYSPAGALETRAAGTAFLEMRSRIERHIEQRTLMLSGVSHDLRTPLTRMRLGLSMLEDSPEATGLAADVTEMERLLDEFLDFARADALDDPELTDICDLVRGSVGRMPAAARAVEVVLPDRPVEMVLRPLAMGRALANLVGNALRYANGARVSVVEAAGQVVLAVEDDGPGIPEAARGEAVKPFVRLDAARNQDRGTGVGLGLSIAEDIARRHGGRLILGESPDLGGLRVEIILPR